MGEIKLKAKTKEFTLTVDRKLADLSISTLVAIDGHLLGASSILSNSDFNDYVKKRTTAMMGDKELAIRECNESRYFCLMLACDYIAVEETGNQIDLDESMENKQHA